MTEDDFMAAFNRNRQRLFLIAMAYTKNRSDSEDILQIVFLKLWHKKIDFESDEHIDKWLTAVSVNESRNCIKSFFRKVTDIADTENEICSFDTHEDFDLFKTVMSLPRHERVVVHMFYYEDMPVRQIAETLRLTESTVKTRLTRARKRLKNSLGDDWINE